MNTQEKNEKRMALNREYQRYYKQTDAGKANRAKYNRKSYEKYQKPAKEWTIEEDALILRHEMPDTELSRITGHGVKAIQIRRSRLKKWKDKIPIFFEEYI